MAKKSVATRSSEATNDTQAPKRGRGRPPKHSVAMPDRLRSALARERRDTDLANLVSAYYNALTDQTVAGAPRQEAERAALRVARRLRPNLTDRIAIELDRLYGPDTQAGSL